MIASRLNTFMDDAVKKYMAEMGKKGGKASKSQSKAGKSAWEGMSKAERSAVNKERAKKAWATRRKKS